MLVLHDKATLAHQTVEILNAKLVEALECPERIEVLLAALESAGNQHEIRVVNVGDLDGGDADRDNPTILEKLLSESHDANYLNHLRTIHSEWVSNGIIKEDESLLPECFQVQPFYRLAKGRGPPKDVFARAGYYAFDLSTGICKDTWKSALASAGLVVEAARLVSVNQSSRTEQPKDVLALCRPPGHHCTTNMAGGYCYLNNAVIAVHALRHYSTVGDALLTCSKVAILDLDFHHGNGTQHYFYHDPSVLYVSIHGQDEYPYYTGSETEIGEGSGECFNVNLPLPVHSSVDQYVEKLECAIQRIGLFKPEYLIVSLGFDTFRLDPLGSFELDTQDYEVIARKVRATKELGEIPTILVLEGGYFLERLGENLVSFLKGWEHSI